MSTPEQYDAIVIGSGEGGKYLAWHLGSQGKKVANVEDKRIGGACPNIACLPSKNVIHSAKVASFWSPRHAPRQLLEVPRRDRHGLRPLHRRHGANVTIIERNPTLVHRDDRDVIELVQQLFKDEGIDIVTSANVTRVEGTSSKSVIVHLSDGARLEGSHLLVATGRMPNTQNMGLDNVGIKTTPAGHFQVNDRLETTAPGVWAIGDCAGSPYFTHASYDDFRIIRDNLAGANRSKKGRQIPSVTFTDPELAHVGLTEAEAKKQGTTYRLGKIPIAAALRSRTLDETRGFMKVLIAPTTGSSASPPSAPAPANSFPSSS